MKRPSGRFVIRMSGALHGRLKAEAMRKGQSLNQVCLSKLQANGSAMAGPGHKLAITESVHPDFLEAVVQRWQKELVGLILFGSAARGDATKCSDIDLMLALEPGAKIVRELYRHWEEFCDQYRGAQEHGWISPHFVSLPAGVREAGGLWYEAALEGIVLWERDRLISRFLGSVREAMVQGKIRRRMLYGSPYWIKLL